MVKNKEFCTGYNKDVVERGMGVLSSDCVLIPPFALPEHFGRNVSELVY